MSTIDKIALAFFAVFLGMIIVMDVHAFGHHVSAMTLGIVLRVGMIAGMVGSILTVYEHIIYPLWDELRN